MRKRQQYQLKDTHYNNGGIDMEINGNVLSVSKSSYWLYCKNNESFSKEVYLGALDSKDNYTEVSDAFKKKREAELEAMYR